MDVNLLPTGQQLMYGMGTVKADLFKVLNLCASSHK